MYEQSKLSELIRFARVDVGATVSDVYPGDGDWTRLFSDVVGPEGRVYSLCQFEMEVGHGPETHGFSPYRCCRRRGVRLG
jgi:predicted methyltransferase